MTILLNNLRRIFGRPINIILMIGVPVVLNILFIYMGGVGATYTIGVIDNDSSTLTSTMLEQLSDRAKIVTFEDDENLLSSALLNSEIDLALKFPENYAQDIIDGNDAKIQTFAVKDSNLSAPILLLIESFNMAAQEFGNQSNGDSDKFYIALDGYVNETFKAEYESFEFGTQENVSRAVSSLGYLAMGMMFLMSFATTLVLEDKVSRVYSRIMTTPVSRGSYLVQHLISYMLVAIIQVVVIINLIPEIMEITFGSTPEIRNQVVAVTLLFSMVCISIGLAISRFSKNGVVAGAFVSLVNLPVLMLGGCLWPRELMPEALQRIGDFMPTTWFLKAAQEVMYGNGYSGAANYLIYLVALSAILLIASLVIKTDDNY